MSEYINCKCGKEKKYYLHGAYCSQCHVIELKRKLRELSYDVFFNETNDGAVTDTLWHGNSLNTTAFENVAGHLDINPKDWSDMNEVKEKLEEKI